MKPPKATGVWLLAALAVACSGTEAGSKQGHSEEVAYEAGQSLEIEAIGESYSWTFRYLATSGERRGRVSRGDLHLPIGADVRLRLLSRDYVYLLALPAFGAKEIAVPGLVHELHFRPQEAGTSPLEGDPMCGYRHEGLLAEVVAESAEDFARWLAGLPDEGMNGAESGTGQRRTSGQKAGADSGP